MSARPARSLTQPVEAATPQALVSPGWTRRRLLGAAGLPLLAAWPPAPALAAPAPGERVQWPAFELIDGRRIDATTLQDQAVLVVFFSTTCPFCARHNVHVQKLVDRLAASAAQAGEPGAAGGLRVIHVAQDASVAPVRDYLARHAYRFDVTMASKPLHEALSARKVIPLSCIVDRAGRLREVIPGEMFEEDVLELARWAKA